MFGPPGHGYVYFIYGCHFCVNAVCCPQGVGEAVLIRAIEPSFGWDLMRQRRSVQQDRHLTSGPGKLCQAMGIDRTLDGVDLCQRESSLFIAANPSADKFREQRGMLTTKRIGITRAAHLPLRFCLRSR
jgi:DNA-3-methyladenine glycosylase